MFRLKQKKGMSLIETVVFIAIATSVFIIVINFFVLYSKTYSTFKATSKINSSAVVAMERITRDIKSATSVNAGSSVFGVHPGKLFLNIGTSTSEFYLENSRIKIKKNNIEIGALTRSDVFVDRLIFYSETGVNSQIIKVEMDLSTTIGASSTKTETFTSSGVLRGRY